MFFDNFVMAAGRSVASVSFYGEESPGNKGHRTSERKMSREGIAAEQKITVPTFHGNVGIRVKR